MSAKFPGKSNNYFQLRTFDNQEGDITLAGVLTEMPTFGLSTNWQDAPISTMANKVKDFFMGDLFKAVGFLGGSNDYQNQLAVGKWSAREYTGTNYGEFDLKFRVYSGPNNPLLEGSSNINEWVRGLSKYAVIDSRATLSLVKLKDNIATGLEALKGTAQYQTIKLILGKEPSREDEATAEKKGNVILNAAETGMKDKDGKPVPTFAEIFNEEKKKWLQVEDAKYVQLYGDLYKKFSYARGVEIDTTEHLGLSNEEWQEKRQTDQRYLARLQKIYMLKIKGGAFINYDGPNWFGNPGNPDKHDLDFSWDGIDFDIPGWGDSGDTWCKYNSQESIAGCIDVGGTYRIDKDKVWQEMDSQDGAWTDESLKDKIWEVQNYAKLVRTFFDTMLDRMNEYLATLVSNQKVEEEWTEENPQADDSLSNKLLGPFRDHERPETPFNKNNGMGAKIWYLDLYQNWLFQKPLVIAISDWKIQPSKEIEGSKGKAFYYDITIHCLMDQVPTAGRWQYMFEGTGDGGKGKILEKHSYDTGDHETPSQKAKFNDGVPADNKDKDKK